MEEKKLKVVLLNGSPHEKGCTFTALSEVAGELKKKILKQRFCGLAINPLGAVLPVVNVPH